MIYPKNPMQGLTSAELLQRFPTNIMQFTGLYYDNKEEIYEGDIVDYVGDICVVEYFVPYASFMLRNGNELYMIYDAPKGVYKKIGTIYENPELLK